MSQIPANQFVYASHGNISPSAPVPNSPMPGNGEPPGSKRLRWVILVLVVIGIVSIVGNVYFYFENKRQKAEVDSAIVLSEQADVLVGVPRGQSSLRNTQRKQDVHLLAGMLRQWQTDNGRLPDGSKATVDSEIGQIINESKDLFIYYYSVRAQDDDPDASDIYWNSARTGSPDAVYGLTVAGSHPSPVESDEDVDFSQRQAETPNSFKRDLIIIWSRATCDGLKPRGVDADSLALAYTIENYESDTYTADCITIQS